MLKKYIQDSEKFHGKLCFSWKGENVFNTAYSASKGNYRKVSCPGADPARKFMGGDFSNICLSSLSWQSGVFPHCKKSW